MKFSKHALAILVALAASSSVNAATWTIQTTTVPGDPGMPIYQEWAKEVNSKTDGRVEIRVVPNDAIVRYDEMFNAVKMNVIQGQIASPAFWSGVEPAFGFLGDPTGAWSDPLQFLDYIYNADGLDLMREIMKPYGQFIVGVQVPGVESFVSKVPIRTVADLKGLKVRSPEGMAFAVFNAVGASPVQMSGNEIYTSLDKNVIDAADAAVFATNYDVGYFDVAPYPVYPGFHSATQMALSVNQKSWDSISDSDKKIIEESFKDTAYEFQAKIKSLDNAALKKVEQSPDVEVISWSPEENQKFRTVALQVWEKWSEKSPMSKKVYASLVDYLKSKELM